MNLEVLVTVFKRPLYVLLATMIASCVFAFAVLLPNFELITTVFSSSTVTFYEKNLLLLSLLGSIETNFTALSASTVIAVAVLFGTQISLLVYYVRRVKTKAKINGTGASGLGGLVSGLFGIGCAACGTFVLTSVLALFGATGLLVFLPFGGVEFGFLGIGLLSYSVYLLLKKIDDPLVCEVM